VLDISVTEIVLQGASIVAVVGKLEAASVTKHVRMDGERHFGGLAKPCHEVMKAKRAHRSATLGNEYVGFCWVLAPQPAQSADLITSDGMNARRSTLGSADMQPALVEFDLMPFEAADLRSPQAVTIGDQDHRCIAMAVSADLASSVHQPLDLALGEIAAFDCEVFSAWCAGIGYLICHEKSLFG